MQHNAIHCETFVRTLGHLEGRNFDQKCFIIGRSYGIALRSIGLAAHWSKFGTRQVCSIPILVSCCETNCQSDRQAGRQTDRQTETDLVRGECTLEVTQWLGVRVCMPHAMLSTYNCYGPVRLYSIRDWQGEGGGQAFFSGDAGAGEDPESTALYRDISYYRLHLV